MKLPKFLVFRYPHGAAGKFLASVMMAHPAVAHFDCDIQENKTPESHLDWMRSKFQPDHSSWLKREPKPNDAWNLHFVSNTYNRGNHLTQEEFLGLCSKHATDYFWQCVDNDLFIPVVWHKIFMPKFYRKSTIISIILDRRSRKWYHRALWYKHFAYKDGVLHLKTHDPANNSKALAQYYDRYQPNCNHDIAFSRAVRQHVILSAWIENFSHESALHDHDLQQSFVQLSDILDINQCCSVIDKICHQLDVPPLHPDHIRAYHNHWKSCHDFKYN